PLAVSNGRPGGPANGDVIKTRARNTSGRMSALQAATGAPASRPITAATWRCPSATTSASASRTMLSMRKGSGSASYDPSHPVVRCVCRKRRPFDSMIESLIVGHDGRADILRLEPGCLALQAQEPTRSGECCPQASGDGTAAQGARSGPLHQRRSPILYPALSLVPVGSQGHDNPAAGDRRALASRWTSPLLALEIRMRGRPAANRCGIAGVDL